MTSDNVQAYPPLLPQAYLPINRCNLPARILGSLTYQKYPVALELDGVSSLHARLFRQLDLLTTPLQRARHFLDYMTVYFLLEKPELAGYTPTQRHVRLRVDYRRLLQGWMFDSDSREGAVLKGWVESRFGLLPRWHKGNINSPDDAQYELYLHDRTSGVYNTNSLEAQLDLLYTYCQYELRKLHPACTPLRLYRGFNHLNSQDDNVPHHSERPVIIMNNLNSFSSELERADEFGDHVMACQVPAPKILYYQNLLPELASGENEYLVIGGMYEYIKLM